MTKHILSAALAASIAALAAGPAMAEPVSVTIPYGDLDMASDAGAQALERRIEAGLRMACERPDSRDLKTMAAWSECRQQARQAVAEQIGDDAELALAGQQSLS